MIVALRRGNASPDMQAQIADILERSFDAKGHAKRIGFRPRGRPKRRIPIIKYEGIAWWIDELWEIHRSNGSPRPHQDALEEAASLENVDVATIKRYFSKSVALNYEVELSYLDRFEWLKTRLNESEALEEIASDMGVTIEMARRRFDRVKIVRSQEK